VVGPLKAFIPKASVEGAEQLVAVTLTSGSASIGIFTRPLAGNSSVGWTNVATIVMSSLPFTPTLGPNSLNRILINPENTELAIWFCEGIAGYGHVLVDPYSWSYSFTPAPSTWAKDPVTNYSPLSGTYTHTFDLKFSIDYVGNTLQYATVIGTRTHVLALLDGPPHVGGYYEGQATWGSTEATIHESIVADFWGVEVELLDYNYHTYSITYYNDIPFVGQREPSDSSTTASLSAKFVYYFGGPNDPILYTTKEYPLTLTDEDHWSNSWLAGRCALGDNACHAEANHTGTRKIPTITVANKVLHNNNTVELSSKVTPEYVYSFGAQPSDYTLPPLALGSQSSWFSTYLEGEWGRTYWGPVSVSQHTIGSFSLFQVLSPTRYRRAFGVCLHCVPHLHLYVRGVGESSSSKWGSHIQQPLLKIQRGGLQNYHHNGYPH
jgi:hypothetical protein